MAEQETQKEEDSKLIDIQEFQDKWCKVLDFSSESLEKSKFDLEAIAVQLDLPHQTVSDLAAVCSLDTLLSGSEPEDKKLYHQTIPADTQLKTLQYQIKDVIKRKEYPQYRAFIYRSMKYNVNNTIHNPVGLNRSDIKEEERVPTPNVILTVDIHRQAQAQKTVLARDQTVLVHGDMLLSEFRDSIDCVNDLAVAGDFSENLAIANHAESCKETFKSGFLYIEEVFYNDTRYADNRDYSKNIIEFMKKLSPNTNYKTASIECVKFSDLSIKLGEPYLYMHQGDCEHIISISDIRMLTADDSQNINDYPFTISQLSRRRIVCKSCMTYTAKWQVEKSNLTPVEPCFLCESCLTSLHYDSDGNKVGHFNAFKFADTYSQMV